MHVFIKRVYLILRESTKPSTSASQQEKRDLCSSCVILSTEEMFMVMTQSPRNSGIFNAKIKVKLISLSLFPPVEIVDTYLLALLIHLHVHACVNGYLCEYESYQLAN